MKAHSADSSPPRQGTVDQVLLSLVFHCARKIESEVSKGDRMMAVTMALVDRLERAMGRKSKSDESLSRRLSDEHDVGRNSKTSMENTLRVLDEVMKCLPDSKMPDSEDAQTAYQRAKEVASVFRSTARSISKTLEPFVPPLEEDELKSQLKAVAPFLNAAEPSDGHQSEVTGDVAQ